MDDAAFERLVKKSGLGEHLEYLHSVRRPALDIERLKPKSSSARSRFGGSPDMPAGMVWPEHHLGPYAFLGQIDFAEIAKTSSQSALRAAGLPTVGLLSLFHAHDENGEWFWQTPGFVRAWFFPPSAALVKTTPPEAMRLGGPQPIAFSPTFDIPANEYQSEGWSDDVSLWELRDALRKKLLPHDDHMLGYPSNYTFAYDPSPGPNWSVLLNVRSHDDLGWCWHDGDRLVAFVSTTKLRKADFSALKCDAG